MSAPLRSGRPRKPRRVSPVWWWRSLRDSVTRRRAEHEPRLIHHDAELAVAYIPGQSDRLVLVFVSGYGHALHPDKLEFRGCAGDQGANNVIFIADLSKCWFSRPGLRERVAQIVLRIVAAKGIRTIWSIGNSIGGYGAILFTDRLPISHVIAFVPQILMTREIIARPAWARSGPGILDTVESDLTTVMAGSGATFWLMYGDQDPEDPLHLGHVLDRLGGASNVHVAIAKGQRHEVAKWLKDNGQLTRLVKAVWTDDWQDLQLCAKKLTPHLDLSLAKIGKGQETTRGTDHDQI